MPTPTIRDGKDEPAAPKAHYQRDDNTHLETIAQLGLIHDRDDHLTPIDVCFNKQEASVKPKRQPREFL